MSDRNNNTNKGPSLPENVNIVQVEVLIHKLAQVILYSYIADDYRGSLTFRGTDARPRNARVKQWDEPMDDTRQLL